jgi:hypothetical protein
VYTPQGGTRGCARATPGVLNAVAATKLTNAQAKSKELVMLLTNFIFISLISFYLSLLFWPSMALHREESFLAVHRSTERKQGGGYAENAETLRTTDYPPSPDSYGGQAADVTDGSLRAA